MANIYKASTQWFTRPDDERFLSLEDLYSHTKGRAERSAPRMTMPNRLKVVNGDVEVVLDSDGGVAGYNGEPLVVDIEGKVSTPTHWSFGQLSSLAGAPASYMRKIHPALAADCLQYGLNFLRDENNTILALNTQTDDGLELRALTGGSYGRIWDHQVVESVVKVNANGNWKIPAASYAHRDPKLATTLYASDRDVFIFLVDPEFAIEVDGDTLFRGFIVWNSEVGKCVFGLMTFLYRVVCDNRIIWGSQDVKELRIRHTLGAPDRFLYEGTRILYDYANASAEGDKARILQLKAETVGKTDEDVITFLRNRSYTKGDATKIVKRAYDEEGQARSKWDILNGATALARDIQHSDDRFTAEQRISKALRVA